MLVLLLAITQLRKNEPGRGKNYGRKLRSFYDVQECKSSPIDIAGQTDWYWQRDELIILKLGRLRLFHEQTVYSSAACGELREFV